MQNVTIFVKHGCKIIGSYTQRRVVYNNGQGEYIQLYSPKRKLAVTRDLWQKAQATFIV
jgi:hypothetical protein